MSYYHKYRPQNFGDIVKTQPSVARHLVGFLVSGKVSHAYLFTGSHGIGKTSCARILAKALNCEHYSRLAELTFSDDIDDLSEFPVPCGSCSACTSILSGTAVDVVEIDAASHRGIDDIRDLRETIRLSPAFLRKKVYIIDEVHMLTTEAFNALLKTLEEPPPHAMFILCTTEHERVPMTIQSRCTLISFRRPSVDTIVGYLQYISESEGLSVTPDALQHIAKLSQGAFRDAAKLLEQSALVSSPITLELVTSLFHGIASYNLADIFATFAHGTIRDFLTIIRDLEAQNADFYKIIHDIIEQFRLFILYKSGVEVTGITSSTPSFDLSLFIASHDYAYFSECIDILLKALQQQRFSPITALPLEIAGLRIISLHTGTFPLAQQPVSVGDTRTKGTQHRGKGHSVSSHDIVSESPLSNVSAPSVVAHSSSAVSHSQSSADSVILEQPPAVTDASVAHSASSVSHSFTFDDVRSRWHEVVRLVKRYNASMATLMSKCKPVRLDGKTLIIETNYSFHKDMLESSKNRPVIEQAIFELLGVQLRIKGLLSNSRIAAKQVDNITEVSHDDLVMAVREIFGA